MKPNYQIVEAVDLKSLSRAVAKDMLDGWIPVGGCSADPQTGVWVQAMTKMQAGPGEMRLKEPKR